MYWYDLIQWETSYIERFNVLRTKSKNWKTQTFCSWFIESLNIWSLSLYHVMSIYWETWYIESLNVLRWLDTMREFIYWEIQCIEDKIFFFSVFRFCIWTAWIFVSSSVPCPVSLWTLSVSFQSFLLNNFSFCTGISDWETINSWSKEILMSQHRTLNKSGRGTNARERERERERDLTFDFSSVYFMRQ